MKIIFVVFFNLFLFFKFICFMRCSTLLPWIGAVSAVLHSRANANSSSVDRRSSSGHFKDFGAMTSTSTRQALFTNKSEVLYDNIVFPASKEANRCASAMRQALKLSIVSMENTVNKLKKGALRETRTYAVRFLTRPANTATPPAEVSFADLLIDVKTLKEVTLNDLKFPPHFLTLCSERNGVVTSPLYDLVRVSSFATKKNCSGNGRELKLMRHYVSDICAPKSSLRLTNTSFHDVKSWRYSQRSVRAFRQYILHADMRQDETVLSFWSVIIRVGSSTPPDVRWTTLVREEDVRFAPRPSILKVLQNVNLDSLENLCDNFLLHRLDIPFLLRAFPFRSKKREYALELLGESFVPINSEIPVLFHSTDSLRDAPLRYRTWILLALRSFINSRPLHLQPVVPFTTPDWTRAVTGQEQVVYLFLSSNFQRGSLQQTSFLKRYPYQGFSSQHRAPSSDLFKKTSTTREKSWKKQKSRLKFARKRHPQSLFERALTHCINKARKDAEGQDRPHNTTQRKSACSRVALNGVVEITDVSLRLAFPTYATPPDCPLTPLQITGSFLPSRLFPPLRVFSTSYINRGTQRALAVFVKKHCSTPDADGVCFFPCYPRNWRSNCRVGEPSHVNPDGTMAIETNWLLPLASFCDRTNPIVAHNRATQRQCAGSGFSLDLSFEERLRVTDCTMIIGTGNFFECAAAIQTQLMDPQIPAHQELSSFGAVTPAEIGRFLRPRNMIHIFGEPIVTPIRVYEEWKKNRRSSQEQFEENLYKGDLMKLYESAVHYCEKTFVTEDLSKETPGNALPLYQFDYCFKTTYTYALLHSLGITVDGPEVYFKGMSDNDEKVDAVHGSVLHTILKDSFIDDLSYLKSDYWRTVTSNDVCKKPQKRV